MERFYIRTFGCQMNEHDSERMAGLLIRHGLLPAATPEEADVLILNTCSVREKPDHKAFSELGRLELIKRREPGRILGIAGCVAQSERERLLRRFPAVDFVLGTRSLHDLWELLIAVQQKQRPAALSLTRKEPLPPLREGRTHPVKAWVTATVGCDNFCSYCIVPYVRGREYSRSVEEILAEVRDLAARGYREVALLGQNVNSYGRDLEKSTTFAGLLRVIDAVEELARIRFFTSHPKDLSDELIAAMAELPKVCEQLHLPAQSGSSRILEGMRRGYTREEYLEKIRRLREAVPEVALSSDFIVGFPGETEEDFAQTMDLVEQVRYDQFFSFMYSPRPHTLAAKLPDDVPPAVKARRLEHLQSRQREISAEQSQKLLGTVQEVLVEGDSRRDSGMDTGRTRCNRVVNILGLKCVPGSLASVHIEDVYANSLLGRRLT
jgi:tRNA-2-methylthio-N6-dimethylallyladenosine synthase